MINKYFYYRLFLFFLFLSNFITGVYILINDFLFILNFDFIFIGRIKIFYEVVFDWVRIIFLSLVILISRRVFFYRVEYIINDIFNKRFIYLLIIFVSSIYLIVISPNIISILLGWDGLGLVSFMLVVYYISFKSYHSGIITVLINRLGDLGILLGIRWLLNFGNLNFLFLDIYYIKETRFIWLLILLAGITKRAQIPFSAWLPAAIAAPTPVSALVHSSTLVTAGVYLLIRLNIYFPFRGLGHVLLYISLITLILSGLRGLYEIDFKKIIALSTLSQLGIIIFRLAIGMWEYSYFHILIHAIFKALLFLCAGYIIHSFLGVQDLRIYGDYVKFNPFICINFNISNICLLGFPFVTGFFSKEIIYYFLEDSFFNFLVFYIRIISIGLTSVYIYRVSFYVFNTSYKYFSLNFKYINLNEIEKSIFILGLGRVFLGWIFNEGFVRIISLRVLNFYENFFIIIIVIIGIYFGYLNFFYFNQKLKIISWFFSSLWLLFWLSGNFVMRRLFFIESLFILERGSTEIFGSQGIYSFIIKIGVNFNFFLNHSLKIFIVGYVIILYYFVIKYLKSSIEFNIEDIKMNKYSLNKE